MSSLAALRNSADWQGHAGPCLAAKAGYDIIACQACGFAHAVPLPDAAALAAEYRERYYSEEKPDYLAHAREDQAWAKLAQDDRLAAMERLLPASRRRLLEIGCGPGFFLQTAAARGWQCSGVEPSRQAAAHAQGLGLDVRNDFFDAQSAAMLGRFDAVHLMNVLEHVPDPIALLTLAIGLLDAGGIVCAGVPNDFSPLQLAAEASGLAPWWVAPPHHLNYFDFASLTELLQRLGLRTAERLTSFPMEAFLLMGEDYTADASLGRGCHNKRKRFDLALESAGLGDARRAFYRALAEAGMGREAVVIAVKP